MKFQRVVGILFITFFYIIYFTEAHAVRPPLKPLNSEQFHKMVNDADVIALGFIHQVILSKTSEPPLETITIQAILTADKILKGDKSIIRIAIEESYKRYPTDNPENVNNNRQPIEKSITVRTAGPAPPVGKYREGDRVLVLLKSVHGSNYYQPLGSGNHDAYLGVFQITVDGVKSDRFQFDDILTGYGGTEAAFINFIISNQGE